MGSQTSPNSIRYPVGSDDASGLAAYFKNLADDTQASLPVYSDTEPAKKPGLLWWAPTAKTLQISDGTSWVSLLSDGGWTASGLSASAGFSLNLSQYRVRNGAVTLMVNATRTGGTLTASSTGNLTDTPVLVLPTGARPAGTATRWYGAFSINGASGTAFIGEDGSFNLMDFTPSGSIVTNNSILAYATFLLG